MSGAMNRTDSAIAYSPLQPLAKVAGTWELEHRDLNTNEEWGGKDTFEWLPGGHCAGRATLVLDLLLEILLAAVLEGMANKRPIG